MKKTMFALACAAVCVAGAGTINSVDFEDYTETGPLFSNGYGDNGAEVSETVIPYFVYTASSGSTDGSTVAEHEIPNASTGWEDKSFGEKYLSLSTEGGTLWRSINKANGVQVADEEGGTPSIEWTTGDPQIVPDTGLYIDTMVQFTPTEDGSEPELGEDAKLAIWLNVAQAEDGTATTNLCVRGRKYTSLYSSTSEAYTFTLVEATGGTMDIQPGKWYRLTVVALQLLDWGNVEEGTWVYDVLSGFRIFLDGKELKPSESPFTQDDIETFFNEPNSESGLTADVIALVQAGKVVPNLDTDGSRAFALSAVGFKGSGAIDDFCVTDEPPSFKTSVAASVDFTLTWDEHVSSVTYTIGNGKPTGPTEKEAAGRKMVIQVNQDAEVTVNATPEAWYKITSGTGTVEVTQSMAKKIIAQLDSLDNLEIIGFDSSVAASDVRDWADEKTISLDALKNNAYAYNSYLLNTDLLTADPVLTIDDVTVADGKMTITVAAKKGAEDNDGASIDLEGINGALYVKTGDTLDSMKEFVVKWDDNTEEDRKRTVTLESGKFAQVKIGAKPPSE